MYPLMTCFYSALRKLNVANNSLTGGFEDGLNDPFHNTWAAVLKENQSMREWAGATGCNLKGSLKNMTYACIY